jgi:hypothetical protein
MAKSSRQYTRRGGFVHLARATHAQAGIDRLLRRRLDQLVCAGSRRCCAPRRRGEGAAQCGRSSARPSEALTESANEEGRLDLCGVRRVVRDDPRRPGLYSLFRENELTQNGVASLLRVPDLAIEGRFI